jgi:Cu-Zn family superoxide dismutase
MRTSPCILLLGLGLALASTSAQAETVRAALNLATATGPGASVGTVAFSDSSKGVSIKLDLHGLPPGPHGLHVHENGSCAPSTAADGKVTPAGAAGPHFDPDASKMHMGPTGEGHLGDLPRVEVAADGTAKGSLKAPRIRSTAEIKGRALMLHVGGDNYSDQPAPLGGGGARLACGVIE